MLPPTHSYSVTAQGRNGSGLDHLGLEREVVPLHMGRHLPSRKEAGWQPPLCMGQHVPACRPCLAPQEELVVDTMPKAWCDLSYRSPAVHAQDLLTMLMT